MFHKPKKLIVTKEKEKRKRKSEEKQRRRRKKNPMVSLLVFIIATLKIHLAIALSKIWLDTYVLGYLSMKYEVKSCHKFSLSGNTFIIIIFIIIIIIIIIIIVIIIINLLQIFF